MDAQEVILRLREAIKLAGGATKWAQQNNVSASIVSDILNGRREPTPQVLARMGIKLVRDYQFIEGNDA